jgi:hypothetical protein
MKHSYWHTYVQETDALDIERRLQRTTFSSGAAHLASLSRIACQADDTMKRN